MERKHEFCKMHILLIAATSFEIQPTLDLLEIQSIELNGHTITSLITGVGQANTTYRLTNTVIQNKYSLVIQAGIAGAFKDGPVLGEVVFVKQDAFGDLGIEEKEKFTTIFDAGFASKNDFPFTNGWLTNTQEILAVSSLKIVKAVTVNKVSDSLLQQQQLVHHFAPQIESMEGAAMHYVCLQQKISFIQIRSVSNLVGERDKSKWAIKDAVINLNIELQKLINRL